MVTHLREQGFLSVAYLDDFLLLARNKSDCLKNVHATISLLERLGFVVNFEKSHLTPSTEIEYLGFNFNSVSLTVGVPTRKQEKIFNLVSKFLDQNSTSIRTFAHLVGTLVSVCCASPYGLLYTKQLERTKFLALRDSEGNFNERMSIPSWVRGACCGGKQTFKTPLPL